MATPSKIDVFKSGNAKAEKAAIQKLADEATARQEAREALPAAQETLDTLQEAVEGRRTTVWNGGDITPLEVATGRAERDIAQWRVDALTAKAQEPRSTRHTGKATAEALAYRIAPQLEGINVTATFLKPSETGKPEAAALPVLVLSEVEGNDPDAAASGTLSGVIQASYYRQRLHAPMDIERLTEAAREADNGIRVYAHYGNAFTDSTITEDGAVDMLHFQVAGVAPAVPELPAKLDQAMIETAVFSAVKQLTAGGMERWARGGQLISDKIENGERVLKFSAKIYTGKEFESDTARMPRGGVITNAYGGSGSSNPMRLTAEIGGQRLPYAGVLTKYETRTGGTQLGNNLWTDSHTLVTIETRTPVK